MPCAVRTVFMLAISAWYWLTQLLELYEHFQYCDEMTHGFSTIVQYLAGSDHLSISSLIIIQSFFLGAPLRFRNCLEATHIWNCGHRKKEIVLVLLHVSEYLRDFWRTVFRFDTKDRIGDLLIWSSDSSLLQPRIHITQNVDDAGWLLSKCHRPRNSISKDCSWFTSTCMENRQNEDKP